MKSIFKRLIATLMVCVIMFVSYASDADTIFSIRASAADYTSKATSILEFYKNGAELDKSKISSSELYVFGVFVSNFLMPFQSNVGNMSSDAFATQMAAMFFGDAYTAQQFADMKYTLGLVQSAQANRSKLVRAGQSVTCSVNTIMQNFVGFQSQLTGISGNSVQYTYLGGGSSDIVWEVNSPAFDAILAQVISVCPSQSGAYMGTAGNMNSELYVDCFGTISDSQGIVIIPACMNPYAFHNHYLDANRQICDTPERTDGTACPIELPINNAFWMGCMQTPRELTTAVTIGSGETAVTDLRHIYVSLPNVGYMVDQWTTSSTALIGIDTLDGSELGIYFSQSIFGQFKEAWKVASGNVDLADQDLQKYGMPDVWGFVGGTSVPISMVLADIALFNTYSSFDSSLASTITVMDMYTNASGSWWALDSSTGTRSDSTIAALMNYVSDIFNSSSYASEWRTFLVSAAYCAMHYSNFYDDKYTNDAKHTAFNAVYDAMESDVVQDIVSSTTPSESYMLSLADAIADSTQETLTSASSSDISMNDMVEVILDSFADHINDPIDTGYYTNAFVNGYMAWHGEEDADGNAIEEVEGSVSGLELFIENIMLAVALTDPCFIVSNADLGSYNWAFQITSPNGMSVTNQSNLVWGESMQKGSTYGFNQSETYSTRYFLQKGHTKSPLTLTSGDWFSSAWGAIYSVTITVLAVLVVIACCVATCGVGLVIAIAATAAVAVTAEAFRLYNKAKQMSDTTAIVSAYETLSESSLRGSVKRSMHLYADMLSGRDSDFLKMSAEQQLLNSYGVEINGVSGTELSYSSSNLAEVVGNAYVGYYTLYSPYKSLAGSLGAVAKVYTTQGIINGTSVSSKVGSYITNDVNLWGGIYYAYMVDIFGLTINSKNEMVAADLETHFPPVSTNLTGGSTLEMDGLIASGTETSSEEEETNNRRTLLARMMELTDLNNSEYRNSLMQKTTNSWITSTHASIVNADSSGSISSIGGGSQYTGYSGYITTSTLSEMPFTSWIMDSYDTIYGVLMLLIIVMAICMLITGHRGWKKSIFTVVCMAVILLIPRLTIDTAVTVSNNIASALYKDRFNFWAYAQHQQYVTDMSNASTKTESLIISNFQQAQDYYDSENGVTLKWMSPKKQSYWDSIASVTGGNTDGLNMSLFTWLFQGQFRQEIYSADPLATYLYRPYLDVVNSAKALSDTVAGMSGGMSGSSVSGISLGSGTSDSDRYDYALKTGTAWQNYYSKMTKNWDVSPAHSLPTDVGITSYLISPSAGITSPGAALATQGVSNRVSGYVAGMISGSVNNIAYQNFVTGSSTDAECLSAYPCSDGGSTVRAGLSADIVDDVSDSATPAATSLQQYYLYTESPYYYFYYMFQSMAKRYTGGSAKNLLISDKYFKYSGNNTSDGVLADNGAHVDDTVLTDYLDLEGLFTFVIPYLEQSNMYVDEWIDIWGMKVKANSSDEYKADLKGIWAMYSPWVDAMYSTTYKEGSIRSVGTSHKLDDAINPGYYLEYRGMAFSPADMQRSYLTEADLSDVESRIMAVLQNTYTDLMYLNNYAAFDDEVLLSAMAMTATFNFNNEFSDNKLIGDSVTLYPTGFEVRNFSYDAFLRLTLLNTTGNSIFSEQDIYAQVIEDTNVVTGIIMLINDAIAVYAVPTLKLVALILLFFLGLMLCISCFLNPPDKMFKSLGKSYFAPFAVFVAGLLGHMLIVSLFVGEGVTSVVGARGITVTTGDPTITLLLLLGVNILFCFLLIQVIKLLIKSFKTSFVTAAAMATGLVTGAVALGAGLLKGARGSVNAMGGVAKTAGRGISRAYNRRKTAKANAKAIAEEGTGLGGVGSRNSSDYTGRKRVSEANKPASSTGKPVKPQDTQPNATNAQKQGTQSAESSPARTNTLKSRASSAIKSARKTVSKGIDKAKSGIKSGADKVKTGVNTLKEEGRGSVVAGVQLRAAKAKYNMAAKHERNKADRAVKRTSDYKDYKSRLNSAYRARSDEMKTIRKQNNTAAKTAIKHGKVLKREAADQALEAKNKQRRMELKRLAEEDKARVAQRKADRAQYNLTQKNGKGGYEKSQKLSAEGSSLAAERRVNGAVVANVKTREAATLEKVNNRAQKQREKIIKAGGDLRDINSVRNATANNHIDRELKRIQRDRVEAEKKRADKIRPMPKSGTTGSGKKFVGQGNRADRRAAGNRSNTPRPVNGRHTTFAG